MAEQQNPEEWGYYRISRKVRDTDPLWLEAREFSRWEAWEDLIARAAYARHPVHVDGCQVWLERGELVVAERFLAEAWGWTRAKVRRFLAKLEAPETEGGLERITRRPAHRAAHAPSIVTLCNYDRWNPAQGADRPTERPTSRPIGEDVSGPAHRAAHAPAHEKHWESKTTTESPAHQAAHGAAQKRRKTDVTDTDSPFPSVTTNPAGAAVEKSVESRTTLRFWMPMIRDHGFGATSADGSILNALLERILGTENPTPILDSLEAAIRGLEILRDRGELRRLEIEKGGQLSMRLLYATTLNGGKEGTTPLWNQAETAYQRELEKRRRRSGWDAGKVQVSVGTP